MTISELSALLPGNIVLTPVEADVDNISYHFWFSNIHIGTIDTDATDDITAINIDSQYKSQIENNVEVKNVLNKNNLKINYV